MDIVQCTSLGNPSSWVRRSIAILPQTARVLDLACGSGRHSALLLAAGHRVIATDRDIAPIGAALGGAPGLTVIAADLETPDSIADPSAAGPFDCGALASALAGGVDGIVVTNYLHRPLLARLPGVLRDGGVLIYETFAVGQARFGKPSRPDFLLRQGELLSAFPGLVPLAYRHGLRGDGDGPPALMQSLCAWKPLADWDGESVPKLVV